VLAAAMSCAPGPNNFMLRAFDILMAVLLLASLFPVFIEA
jgi:hypothetical protein